MSTSRDDLVSLPAVPHDPIPPAAGASETAATANGTEFARQFHELACQWKQATAFSSSLTEMKEHPAYQQIIGLGKEAIPLILDELR